MRSGCVAALPGPATKLDSPTTPQEESAPGMNGWIHFPQDTLLISSAGYAHVPGGCTHLTEANVLAGNRWGRVPAFDRAGWLRISAASPVQATEGNTARKATKRCADCTRNI